MKRNQVNIRLDVEMMQRLERLAQQQKRTRSNMAEYLMHKVFNELSEDELTQMLTSGIPEAVNL